MTKRQNKGVVCVVSQATHTTPQTTAARPRLRDLPESISIKDRAGIVAVLNRDALLDALAKAIFTEATTPAASAQQPAVRLQESA